MSGAVCTPVKVEHDATGATGASSSPPSTPEALLTPKREVDVTPSASGSSPGSAGGVSPITPGGGRRNKRKMREPRKRSEAVKKICLDEDVGGNPTEDKGYHEIPCDTPPPTPDVTSNKSSPGYSVITPKSSPDHSTIIPPKSSSPGYSIIPHNNNSKPPGGRILPVQLPGIGDPLDMSTNKSSSSRRRMAASRRSADDHDSGSAASPARTPPTDERSSSTHTSGNTSPDEPLTPASTPNMHHPSLGLHPHLTPPGLLPPTALYPYGFLALHPSGLSAAALHAAAAAAAATTTTSSSGLSCISAAAPSVLPLGRLPPPLSAAPPLHTANPNLGNSGSRRPSVGSSTPSSSSVSSRQVPIRPHPNVVVRPTSTASIQEATHQQTLDNSTATNSARGRKNYKNMTRERRVEANARERSRVHTISAAFDALRRAVPSYSYNQKLSKLAILRIACSYILALARLADLDYSEDGRAVSFDECVDLCTATIQTEGRARRRH